MGDVFNSKKTGIKSIGPFLAMSYTLPCIPTFMLWAPMAIIQGIYAKHYGISLTTLASIIILSRLLDAISDPIIGYYSDRYRVDKGTRKPFILFGSLLVLLCSYFLYFPPGEVTALYAGFWFIAFYTAYTIFEIPHITWPSDIARHSHDKTKLYSYRVFGSYCGLALFYVIPLLPLFESSAITPDTLKVTFFVAAGITLPFICLAMRVVPDGKPSAQPNSLSRPPSFRALMTVLKEVGASRPIILFLLAFIFGGFAMGMWYGLIYIYVDSYLDMGEQFAQLFLIAFGVGILVTPLWYKLTLALGKKNTWVLAITILILSFIATGFLEPESTTFIQLLLLKSIQTTGFVCLGIVTPAMLSEIIDYSSWKSGRDRGAIYFSMKVFFEKANMAAGAALGLAIAGWSGFDAAAGVHMEESIVGLKIAIAMIPSFFGMVSLVFIALSPINERRHRIIMRWLDTRLARSEAMNSTSENSSL